MDNSQNMSLYVAISDFYAQVLKCDDVEITKESSFSDRVDFADMVYKLKDEFEFIISLADFSSENDDEHFDFDDEGMPKGYGHEKTDQMPMAEIADIYVELLFKSLEIIDDVPLYSAPLIDQISHIAGLANNSEDIHTRLNKILKPKYAKRDFVYECNEAIAYCMNIFEAIEDEAYSGTFKFGDVLGKDFSFEEFGKQALRAAGYLTYRVNLLEAWLEVNGTLDTKRKQLQIGSANVAAKRRELENAGEAMEDFMVALENVRDIYRQEKDLHDDSFFDFDIDQLMKIRKAISDAYVYLGHPMSRYPLIVPRFGSNPADVDVVLSVLALQDKLWFRPDINGDTIDNLSSMKVEDLLDLFLDYSDDIVCIAIELDHLDGARDVERVATPLSFLVNHFVDVNHRRYQKYGDDLVRVQPGEVNVPHLLYSLSRLNVEKIDEQLNSASIEYLTNLQSGTDSQGPIPPSLFLNPN